MEVEEKEGEFDWDQNERALILGSYYYGYTVMQVFFPLLKGMIAYLECDNRYFVGEISWILLIL